MSCKCNCSKTTPQDINYVLPDCSNAEKCTELINTDCIVYTGTTLSNLNINTGDRLTSILVKLNTLLGQ